MRLGLSLCIPHECRCGTLVGAEGLHAMVCKKAPAKHARHHVLNDIIWRVFGTASTPAFKEPSGLSKNDGKLTLISSQRGKPLVWNTTVVTALVSSYVDKAATGAGVVSDLAADRKIYKYSSLSSSSDYTIQPVAVDNLGGFITSATSFLTELGRRLSSVSNDSNETAYLFQRISVTLQLCAFFQTTHQTNSHSRLTSWSWRRLKVGNVRHGLTSDGRALQINRAVTGNDCLAKHGPWNRQLRSVRVQRPNRHGWFIQVGDMQSNLSAFLLEAKAFSALTNGRVSEMAHV